jgi:tetratricopeptide (TPR) repeat protein
MLMRPTCVRFRSLPAAGVCLTLLFGAALGSTACSEKTAAADHVARAQAYAAKQDTANAVLEYRTALQKDPKLGDARLALGDIYAQMGDSQNAYREYIRAADTLPESIDAQLKAGAMLLLANQFADAKTRAEKVLRLSPRHPGALTLLGNALAGLNDMTGALDRLNDAILADPSQGRLYSNVGVLQLARGDRQMAEASFKKAVNATPDRVEPRVALAHFYRTQRRDQEAEALLKEALAIDPASVQVNSNLAQLFVETGRLAEAEAPIKSIAEARHEPASQFVLADYYTQTGKTKEAAAILDKLAETKATYALARARLAAIDYTEGRAAEAHAVIDEVLKREPSNRTALLLKGRLLLIEKQPDPALDMATRAIAADPAHAADAYFLRAQSYLSKGLLEDAQDALKEVLKFDPRAASAHVLLSQLYSSRGEKQAAVDFAQQAVAAAPGSADARLALVRGLLAAGQTERADKELRLLVNGFPSSPAVHVQVGALYLARHDADAARAAFSKALELDKASSDALAGMVALDLVARKAETALGRVRSRLADSPGDAAAWLLAARAYALVGDGEQTERALLKAIELNSSNTDAYAMLGELAAMRGRLDEALRQFQTWVQREPRSIAAHTMVGVFLERLNRIPEAKAAYERALELDRHAAIAANNLAWLHAEHDGNLDIATELAQAAKSQAPDQPAFNDTLGWIYYKKNLVSEAVALFRQSLEKDPNNALTHYHLGMAYAKMGEDTLAIGSLRKALAIDPRLTTGDEARRTLHELDIR